MALQPAAKKSNLKYVELASANANQTYAAQLATLYTTYSNLSSDEKQLTRLRMGTAQFFDVQRADLGIYNCCLNAAGSWFLLGADLYNHKYYTCQNFGTITDASNQTNPSDMVLCILDTE